MEETPLERIKFSTSAYFLGAQILLEFGLFRLSVSLHGEIFRGRTFVLLGAHFLLLEDAFY